MNELIKEFLDQSRVQNRGYFIYQYGGPTGHQSVEKVIDLEKFAELIVRECTNMLPPDSIRDENGVHMFYVIRDHFGISGVGR